MAVSVLLFSDSGGIAATVNYGVSACLEILEILGEFMAVGKCRDIVKKPGVKELVREKSCQGYCLLLASRLGHTRVLWLNSFYGTPLE